MSSVSVLIKPVSGRCNLKCEYCFYNDIAAHRETADFGLMSEETLEAIVREVFRAADTGAAFSFQGGEPTLRGLDFYRSFMLMQQRYNTNNIPVTNCLQTNGILIDDEWAAFLTENSFLVGLSLDGPREIHDAFRRHIDGAATYSEVMRAAKIMKKHGTQFNILFTVTSKSAAISGKLYSFFRKNGFDFLQFMPCMDPSGGERGRENFSLLPQEFGVFLRHFFERWSAEVLSGGSVSVRYFDNLVSMAAGLPPEACSMRGMCSCQFVFEADGSCYPCDFYVTDQRRMGSIHESGLEELFSSAACQSFLSSGSRLPEDCRTCSVRGFCRGGCRRDRENSAVRNYYCRAYRGFLEYAAPKLRELAVYIAGRNRAAHDEAMAAMRSPKGETETC